MNVVRKRSRVLKDLDTVRLCTFSPGPSRTNCPALPNVPGRGTVNAAASNQCSSVRWSAGRLPLAMRSGRPPDVFVFDGSEPEKLGVKNWPVSIMLTQFACQPPRTKSTGPGACARNFLPWPKGMAQLTVITPRNLELYWSWLQRKGA